MLGLKLNHVSKRGQLSHACHCYFYSWLTDKLHSQKIIKNRRINVLTLGSPAAFTAQDYPCSTPGYAIVSYLHELTIGHGVCLEEHRLLTLIRCNGNYDLLGDSNLFRPGVVLVYMWTGWWYFFIIRDILHWWYYHRTFFLKWFQIQWELLSLRLPRSSLNVSFHYMAHKPRFQSRLSSAII